MVKNSVESIEDETNLRTKNKRAYTTTNIPLSLMARINEVLKEDSYGYASRTDFILDSIRRRLRELDYLK